MENYEKTLLVNKTPGEVYKALTEKISAWWSNDFSGSAASEGDTFIIAFGETKKTFLIEETRQDQQVIWKCVKAYIDMPTLKNKSEWEGTRQYWNLTENENGTAIKFLHEGLNPQFECYDICEEGWDMFLSSLESFINTGIGSPYLKEQA